MTVAYFPDRIADDPSLNLKFRVVAEVQRRGGLLDWTPPLIMTTLAKTFDRAPATVRRAFAQAVREGYLEKQPVSLPRGGRGARYRAVLEPSIPTSGKAGGKLH